MPKLFINYYCRKSVKVLLTIQCRKKVDPEATRQSRYIVYKERKRSREKRLFVQVLPQKYKANYCIRIGSDIVNLCSQRSNVNIDDRINPGETLLKGRAALY